MARPNKAKNYTAAEKIRILKVYADNGSFRKTARETGATYLSIKKWLAEMKVPKKAKPALLKTEEVTVVIDPMSNLAKLTSMRVELTNRIIEIDKDIKKIAKDL